MTDRSNQQQVSTSEAESCTSEVQVAAAKKGDLLSWDDLLPYVRQRLERRRADLGASASTGGPTSRFGLSQDTYSVDAVSESSAEQQAATASSAEQEAAAEAVTVSPPAAVHKSVTEQMKRLAAEAREAAMNADPKRRGLRPTVRRLSLLGSGVLHILLVLALAMVGLARPEQLAGLSFQSVATELEKEPFELMQSIEVAAPEESTSAPSSENAIDFSEQLTPVQPLSNVLASAPSVSQRLAHASASSSAKSAVSLADAASFFGASAGGNNFCYVIDASGSMRGGPWEAARRELLKSLSSLSPRQRFYIITYTGDIIAIPMPGQREAAPHHLYATRENLDHAARWLLSLRIGGSGASPKDALEFAISKEPDAIYLLTDGVTRVKDVAEFVRKRNRVHDLIHGEQIRTPIHTIAFYSLQGQQLLRRLAGENGGQFIYVPDPEASR